MQESPAQYGVGSMQEPSGHDHFSVRAHVPQEGPAVEVFTSRAKKAKVRRVGRVGRDNCMVSEGFGFFISLLLPRTVSYVQISVERGCWKILLL
jgi:hypothetical protein